MEWLLIVFSMGWTDASSFADGGYLNDALCRGSGESVVAAMNAKEKAKQDRNTRRSQGSESVGYAAKTWVYECVRVHKRP